MPLKEGIHEGIPAGSSEAGIGRESVIARGRASVVLTAIDVGVLGEGYIRPANWETWARRYRPLTDVEMELARTKKELAEVKMERDILKKAAAYFARESLPGTR